MIDRENSLPSPRELVRHVGEIVLSDDHKVKVYDKALDKANELGVDVLDYTVNLADAIRHDLLRNT